MKIIALLLLLASPAWSYCTTGPYTHSGQACVYDQYVTDNLVEWADRIQERRAQRFLRDLGCWASDDGHTVTVTCKDGDKRFERKEAKFGDFQGEPTVMVPSDEVGKPALASIDAIPARPIFHGDSSVGKLPQD